MVPASPQPASRTPREAGHPQLGGSQRQTHSCRNRPGPPARAGESKRLECTEIESARRVPHVSRFSRRGLRCRRHQELFPNRRNGGTDPIPRCLLLPSPLLEPREKRGHPQFGGGQRQTHSCRNQTWATLYNRAGVVKRHFDRRKVLTFPSLAVLVLVWLLVLLLFLLTRPRLAFRISRWTLGSTNHLFGHSTSDHDSLFRLPNSLREARRPISPTVSYCFTRVAHGLPCMRTSCA